MDEKHDVFETVYESPLGRIRIKSEKGFITKLDFHDGPTTVSEDPVIHDAVMWLERYFRGTDPGPVPPLNPIGTSFRMMVWNILQTVPYGATITYGEIAKTVAKEMDVPRMSAQAVGNAVGHNPIAIMIPCHRVIGSDGDLVGYAGGLTTKSGLLKLEGIQVKDRRYRQQRSTSHSESVVQIRKRTAFGVRWKGLGVQHLRTRTASIPFDLSDLGL